MAKESKLGKFLEQPQRKEAPSAPRVTKANGKLVGVTIRFDPDDWRRLRHFATDKNTSIQQIVMLGCSKVLADDGQKPLKVAPLG
jgi:hypothetical protein